MTDNEQTRAEMLGRAKELRQEFAATAAQVDQTGAAPFDNLKRLQKSGLGGLSVPPKWGGYASDDCTSSDLDIFSEVLVELSAGESSTAQIWSIHTIVARLIFSAQLEIDADLQQQLAADVLAGRVRLSNASAEGGAKRGAFATTATRKGDQYIVSGTKIFATGSEGSDYAIVPAISDGVPGGGLAYFLIPLDAEGVRQHHDWDNMGQRATGSGTITFEEVVVPARHLLAIKGGVETMMGPNSAFGLVFQTGINSVILGMGLGAFDVTCEFVRDFARPNLPTIESAAEDPVNQWHAGRLSAQLAAARARLRASTRASWTVERDGGARAPVSGHMMRSK